MSCPRISARWTSSRRSGSQARARRRRRGCARWPPAGRPSSPICAQLADVPTIDPRSRTVVHALPTLASQAPVAVSIDIMDEVHSLVLALKALASDASLRQRLGANALDYWRAHHTVAHMVEDYERAIARTSAAPAPVVTLPAHLRSDGFEHARDLATSARRDASRRLAVIDRLRTADGGTAVRTWIVRGRRAPAGRTRTGAGAQRRAGDAQAGDHGLAVAGPARASRIVGRAGEHVAAVAVLRPIRERPVWP